MSKPSRINRRRFVRTAVGGAAATAAACAGGGGESGPAVQTGRTVRWRLASAFPRGLDTLFGINEFLSERVDAMSGGAFTIRVYPAGEIVPAFQVLDAAQQGTVQMANAASYYFTGKNPALAFDAGVPFGLTARQQMAWLAEGGGSELMNELFADFNVMAFPAGSTGVQMGGWFRRELSSVADLRGLKMRIPGLGGEVMSRLGVTVQVLPGGEIFPALETGAIDATEWVGPHDDERLGLHQIVNNYYTPGWWEPGPTLSFYVNLDAWAQLPAQYREMLRSAMNEAAIIMTARYDALNPPALQRLLAAGVQLRRFPDDIMAAALRASFDLYEEQASADAAYRKVYEQWKVFRRQSYAWFETAELAYSEFAFRQTD
jgi:TRAP-type mannitol/chloroaromatic compound transport system substrate-binding protein